jgi:DNA-binding response OmpR family regulator
MTTTPSKILVIDDDPDFRAAVTAILKSGAYTVITADDAVQGGSLIRTDKPDLILLDLMMDGLFDGFSLCHAVKTSKDFESVRHTPIIVISAVKDIAGARFGFKGEEQGLVGPDDYLDKPVRPADLLARIERLLKK